MLWAGSEAPSTGDGSAAVATAVSDGESVVELATTVGVAVPAEPVSSSAGSAV